jgi:hypothetical protein
MTKILGFLIFFNLSLFARAQYQLSVEWHEYYWHTPMIQNKYSEWPQKSTIQMDILSQNKIKIYSIDQSFQKIVLLRDDQSASLFISNPNLLKPIIFGMRPENSMVNIRYNLSNKHLSPRIKGARDPGLNYLPNKLKY